jgi:hypothetical protein
MIEGFHFNYGQIVRHVGWATTGAFVEADFGNVKVRGIVSYDNLQLYHPFLTV